MRKDKTAAREGARAREREKTKRGKR